MIFEELFENERNVLE